MWSICKVNGNVEPDIDSYTFFFPTALVNILSLFFVHYSVLAAIDHYMAL